MLYSMLGEHDFAEFIPAMIKANRRRDGLFKEYPAQISPCGKNYSITYNVPVHNQTGNTGRTRKIMHQFPRKVNIDTFCLEGIGLLQGEMSKTHRGPLTVCNSEPRIIRHFLKWFQDYIDFPLDKWHWYIRTNLPPFDDELNAVLTGELIEHWMTECDVAYEMRYPKTLTFTPSSKNLVANNEGSLILEFRGNVFVQTVQRFVKKVTSEISEAPKEAIVAYMKGVFAAESCINYRLETGHRRVFITATNQEERSIFQRCLKKLGVDSYDCKKISDLVISRRDNLERLDALGLLSLHPVKHARFREMLSSYQ